MAITRADVVTNGDTPQINRGIQYDYPHLYTDGFPTNSTMFASLKMKAGFGWVEAGTVVAEDANGEFVPYVPTTYSDNVAVSPLVADHVAAAVTVQVSELESGKYAVGDVIVLANTDPDYLDGGAITDISVANGIATITFTNASGAGADFTVAKDAHIYVKSGASGKFSTAVAITDRPVDTDTGSDAKGAQVSAVIANAIMYSAPMFNLDSAALTSLGAVKFGNRAYIK